MRKYIIWTLSILLGFEPALWAEGSARQQAELKSFLEKTEIAKRPVSYRELYERMSSYLPPAEKQNLKKWVDQYGNEKLPRVDVSKVKGSGGHEYVQLQAVQNGKSVSMEIINEGNVFARINGQTLTMQDMQSLSTVLAKVGVPTAEASKYSARGPASTPKSSLILAPDQIMKLNRNDQIQYFKHLRQLLESMEAVGNASAKHKTSLNTPQNKFEVIAHLLAGESAFAAKEIQCVAAGYVAVARTDASGRLKCGSDGENGVDSAYRGSCSADKFQCNPAIYGSTKICIAGSRDTTRDCNSKAKENDIPKLAKDDKDFIRLKSDAESYAEKVMSICQNGGSSSDEGGSEEQAPPATKGKKKNKKASKASGGATGLEEDQRITCENFEQRYNEIKSWSCADPDFAGKYPNACPKPDSKPTPEPPPAAQQPAPPPVQQAPAGPVPCDQLGAGKAPEGSVSESECSGSGGSFDKPQTGAIYCLNSAGQQVRIVTCTCPNGYSGKFSCTGGKVSKGDGDDGGGKGKHIKDKASDFLSKNKTWLIVGGFGLLGLVGYWYLDKKAKAEQYKQLEPVPQAPPIPPPTTPTVPAPRGAV